MKKLTRRLALGLAAMPFAAPMQAQMGCTSSARSAGDSVTVLFVMSPPPTPAKGSQPSDYLVLANGIREHLAPPIAVELPTWPHTIVRGLPAQAVPVEASAFGVGGQIDLRLDSLGHLVPASVEAHTGSDLLDRELVAATLPADTAGDLAFAPPIFRGTKEPVAMEVMATSVPMPTAVAFARYRTTVQFGDTPPVRIQGPSPVYPRLAQQYGIPDSVRVQFIVGTNGRVEPESFRVLKVKYQEFADAAAASILATTFKPGLADGCPIRVLVQTTVIFKLPR